MPTSNGLVDPTMMKMKKKFEISKIKFKKKISIQLTPRKSQ